MILSFEKKNEDLPNNSYQDLMVAVKILSFILLLSYHTSKVTAQLMTLIKG